MKLVVRDSPNGIELVDGTSGQKVGTITGSEPERVAKDIANRYNAVPETVSFLRSNRNWYINIRKELRGSLPEYYDTTSHILLDNINGLISKLTNGTQ